MSIVNGSTVAPADARAVDDRVVPLRFDEAEEAAAAAGAADLAGERPGLLRRVEQRSISGVVTAGASRLRASHSADRCVARSRQCRRSRAARTPAAASRMPSNASPDLGIAVDPANHHVPVVDAGLARRPRVREHQPPPELLGVDVERGPPDAGDRRARPRTRRRRAPGGSPARPSARR